VREQAAEPFGGTLEIWIQLPWPARPSPDGSPLVVLGCQVGQGYLFARPAPAADFEALLVASHPPRRAAVKRVPRLGIVARREPTAAS
jgi:hypothetical protein